MTRYVYIRVSAKDQNPDRQLLAMQEQHIKQQNIYVDKMSGTSFVRPRYTRLLKRLKKGNVIVVKSIDRLGRNYEEILEQWRLITKDIGAETERAFIRQRQAEGIAVAKQKGVRFGCTKKELPQGFEQYYQLRVNEKYPYGRPQKR